MLGLALSLAFAAQAGIPAIDQTVTPPRPLAAPRAAAPLGDTCDEPVLLIVTGDSNALREFRRSAVSGTALSQLGGYALTAAVPAEPVAASAPGLAVLRFPCSANAASFWKNGAQRAGLSGVIYSQEPLPPALVGKVGDDGYRAAFGSDGGIPAR